MKFLEFKKEHEGRNIVLVSLGRYSYGADSRVNAKVLKVNRCSVILLVKIDDKYEERKYNNRYEYSYGIVNTRGRYGSLVHYIPCFDEKEAEEVERYLSLFDTITARFGIKVEKRPTMEQLEKIASILGD